MSRNRNFFFLRIFSALSFIFLLFLPLDALNAQMALHSIFEVKERNDGLLDSAWPMYCHDTRHTGRSPYTPTGNWRVEKWRFKINGGSIFTSPAIDKNGTLYVGSTIDSYFYALYQNGTMKWRLNIGPMHSSPAISKDGTIYIGTDAGRLYAICPNGTIHWWISLGSGWAFSSPAIDNNGTIYCAVSDSYRLAAVNPNGTIKWYFYAQSYIYCDPAIGEDGTIIIGSNDGNLYALNPNGTLRWRFYGGGPKGIGTYSIADDGTIYAGGTEGYLYALRPNGTLKWEVSTGWIGGSTPAIADDGTIYVGDQDFHRLYSIAPNGTINWFYKTADDIISSPLIDAKGTIYCGSWDNNLYAINKNGTLRWIFTAADEGIDSSAVIADDGTIYISGLFAGTSSTPDYAYLFALGSMNDTQPITPSITGDQNGHVRRTYDYTIVSTDPDNDTLSYYIDWGDGKTTNWTTPTPSGQPITKSHTWLIRGSYDVKVKARDEHLRESDWGTLHVTMPCQPPRFPILHWLLDHFPNAFPLLRRLLDGPPRFMLR